MNEYFVVIFGSNSNGDDASTIRLFTNINQLDDILDEQSGDYDYYKPGLIDANGKIKLVSGDFYINKKTNQKLYA